MHVRRDRHMVFGDVGVHHATEAMIDQRLLVQGHANTQTPLP